MCFYVDHRSRHGEADDVCPCFEGCKLVASDVNQGTRQYAWLILLQQRVC